MKNRLLPLVVCLSALLIGTNAFASGIAFKECRQAQPSLVARLKYSIGRDWKFYRRFMETCPVFDPKGRIVLRVIALSLPKANSAGRLFALDGRAWDSQADNASYDTIPAPLVLDTTGRVFARLPVDVFPMEPITTQITFRDWSHGKPLRIVTHQTDPTVSPPISSCHARELVWDASGHHYVANPHFCSQVGTNQAAHSGD